MFERTRRWFKNAWNNTRDCLLALCFLVLVAMIAFGPLVFGVLIISGFACVGVVVAYFTGSWLAGAFVFLTITAFSVLMAYDPGHTYRRRR